MFSEPSELIEREEYLAILANTFAQVSKGFGHTVFITGEAGIGKTSLVNTFLKTVQKEATIYSGACDSLLTPRPLGPLWDIAAQVEGSFLDAVVSAKDRGLLFTLFLQRLFTSNLPVIVVFEDVHWSDEATLDFIKFFGRRIQKQRCLFILTFRDDEIAASHALKNMAGELPPPTFKKLSLNRLTEYAVVQWAKRVGVKSGHKIFELTQGNPFYVSEVLDNNSETIPERVKDSVLASFYSRPPVTQMLWELLSVLPAGIAVTCANTLRKKFPGAIEEGLDAGVFIIKSEALFFKHELYRIAIENSLSAIKKKSLHKEVIEIIKTLPPESISLSQQMHHALCADDHDLIRRIAPRAAQEAAAAGAHTEAAQLFSIAIKFFEGSDSAKAELYEKHAYECYLTHQLELAVESQRTALRLWTEVKNTLKIGDTLRFLSRLLWYNGAFTEVQKTALEAIEVLENGFPTRERAFAYSNLSQLSMLSGDIDRALHWGEKALDLASRMEDNEIVSHALTNIGCVLSLYGDQNKSIEKLATSLNLAIEHSLHEHAARAYTGLCSMSIVAKRYPEAEKFYREGTHYCERYDLDSWIYYMQSEYIKILLSVGELRQAETLATKLYSNTQTKMVRMTATAVLAKINMRRGDFDEAEKFIKEGWFLSKPSNEAMRIVPIMTAWIEFCWLTELPFPEEEIRNIDGLIFPQKTSSWYYSDFVYWLQKANYPIPKNIEYLGPFQLEANCQWRLAAEAWDNLGFTYEKAIALFHLDEKNKKQAISLLTDLGAVATRDLFARQMRALGIKNIPRKPHQSTLSNPALLTKRQFEILKLLREGYQNKEIAEALFISLKTVDTHVSAILSKLNAATRAKAVAEAQRLCIIN